MEREIVETLERLSQEAAISAESDSARRAAKATGGLPLQCDMGGVLVLTPLGTVLHYDPETGAVASVDDDRWKTAALVKAARRYPELIALFPVKPSNAVVCLQCRGTGMILGTLDCGKCMGAGWLAVGSG